MNTPILIASIALMPALASGTVIFEQDFSAGGVPGDYVGANPNDFTSFTQDPDGGPWSILSEALVLDRTAVTSFSTTNQMFTQNVPSTPILSMSFSLNIDGASTNNIIYDGKEFILGNTGVGGGTFANRLTGFQILGAGAGLFEFSGGTSTFNLNQTYDYYIYTNNTAAAGSSQSLTYVGPDGLTHSLDDNNWSLWLGTTQVFDNVVNTYSGASVTGVEGFTMNFRKPDEAVWNFDDFVVRNDLDIVVPEPATISVILSGLAILGMTTRRRCYR